MEDAQAELDRVKEERKGEQETVIDQRMFGVDVNGQQGILEAQGAGTAKA